MSELVKNISDYYTLKLKEFGPTAKGVDWNSAESQQLRFEKLLSIIEHPPASFSLLDYGCGFGSMNQYMKEKFSEYDYTGFDISSAMISEAKKTDRGGNARWVNVLPEEKSYDYVIASGIFNVRLQNTEEVWLDYMYRTLDEMNDLASKGFAFNILSTHADPEKRKEYLYYADPREWLEYCKMKFSSNVTLLHDYTLFEFTIHVKK